MPCVPCNLFFAMMPIGCIAVLVWARFGEFWEPVTQTNNQISENDESRRKWAVRRRGRERFIDFFVGRIKIENNETIQSSTASTANVTDSQNQVVTNQPRLDSDSNLYLFEVKAVISSGYTMADAKKRVCQNLLEEGCSICLQCFDHTQPVTIVPCNHLYHSRCLRTWLTSNATCPSCRVDFNAEPESSAEELNVELSPVNASHVNE